MDNPGDGANYVFSNNISYTSLKVPTLYMALSAGDLATDPPSTARLPMPWCSRRTTSCRLSSTTSTRGVNPSTCTGTTSRRFTGPEGKAGTFAEFGAAEADLPAVPMRRDTTVLEPEGNAVLHFRADNPCVWLFHCHIKWHVASGLIATFVEAPLELQGNAVDLLDVTGENRAPDPLPDGYASGPRTTRQTATLFAVWSALGYGAANAERWAAESSTRERTLAIRWQKEHGRPPPPSLMGATLPGTSREQLHYRSWMSFLAGLCMVRGVISYRPIIVKQIGVRPVTWAYDVLAGMAGLGALGAALRLGHLEMVRERLEFDLGPDLRSWPY
ncbi:hypothetical protein DL768_011794 [Monosporascus sp. mg162]|nr:hypothetical protein DL768_011794 [Monosporascus sp. mg162]